MSEDLVRDHQNTLLAEVSRERRGDRLARSQRLHHRAAAAVRRARRASEQAS